MSLTHRIDGDSRIEAFNWQAVEQSRKLTTSDLVRLFGIPKGAHLFIEYVSVWSDKIMEMFLDLESSAMASINELTEISGPTVRNRRRHFVHLGDATLTEKIKYLNMEVFDSIDLFKLTNTDSFTIIFQYRFVSGSMMWLDEWAALIRDKFNVTATRDSSRGLYHQVGDVWQIGKRGH